MMTVVPAAEQSKSTSVSDSDSLKQDTTIRTEEQESTKTSGKRSGN